MATLHLTPSTTVEALRKEFFDAFGAQVKVYNGRSRAELTDTLGCLGLKEEALFECRSSLTAGSFIERMERNHGLKVKVYTCDEWVAVLDGLTLESAGKVKRGAVKADMEDMIAYQRKDNGLGGYELEAREDGGYIVRKDGVECDNTIAAMREMAALIGMEYDDAWTTTPVGARLMKAISDIESPATPQGTNAEEVKEAAKAEAEAAAKAKAEAEAAAKAKSEAEAAAKAKAEAERLAAESAAAQAAKKAAEQARAEQERLKAEANAAKAELERLKAEAEKAKAEAEKAKAAAAAAQAEATKPKPQAAAKQGQGALPGLFSVGENKKVRFSMGNLQFHCKNYEFRFAEHQWEFIGLGNRDINPTYDGWIDLFGYGTSGYMGCQPTETSTDKKQYPQQDIAGTNYDWGVYNPISNGGNKEGLWRTMTEAEWEYLLRERPNADKLHIKATVNGNKGMMLLPDNFYEQRVRVPIDATPNNYFTNNYTEEAWKSLEELGAVFFVEAGYRENGNHVITYWLYYNSSSFYYLYTGDWITLYGNNGNGSSVRLVQDVK